ncbi:helix-turn-helix transcriptional regulator [Thermus hydrothermalis]|uniref:helix-turn-helix transcriptional regulator n=1 Tax=Thermus hydrothermalis TaxID=2908148 RepID=UPI001FAABC70|nr:helix-turn-helix domain-containing protein [Thermus hydrothermalis]
MRNALVGMLLLAYVSTLAMSAGHLAQWYALSLGALPGWLAWGLAASLEFTAFLLSLLSNSYLRGSAWAGGGALAALGLVWVGNALSMLRSAPGLSWAEVGAMSLFVPVGTYVVGKVVGELLRGSAPVVRAAPTGTAEAVQMVPGGAAEGVQAAPGGNTLATERPRGVPEGAVPVGGGVTPAEPEGATLRYTESRTVEWRVEGRGEELVAALSQHRGPVTLGALARELGWPKTTVRRWLDRLEASGVVCRTGEGWSLVDLDHAVRSEGVSHA